VFVGASSSVESAAVALLAAHALFSAFKVRRDSLTFLSLAMLGIDKVRRLRVRARARVCVWRT